MHVRQEPAAGPAEVTRVQEDLLAPKGAHIAHCLGLGSFSVYKATCASSQPRVKAALREPVSGRSGHLEATSWGGTNGVVASVVQ